ncbi:triose-phosphate isomerase family protein [Rathayibacter soli]|uniref:triose-phosphate isomerase family protein n=1 Tax=Rathayibacter soli TaxID=3144168 RepID=UPI0027E559CC|nr:triose-phosphate isomerase family protein [Glaciibacter superstes]
MSSSHGHPTFVGVSLKMYFDQAQTLRWCNDVAAIARVHEAVVSGAVEVVVLPGFTALPGAATVFAGTGVALGAQNLFWEDAGAFTGEVSGPQLVQVGCGYVEIGHAERRRLFFEDESILQLKLVAALRNELAPILCVGETTPIEAGAAADACIGQLESITGPAIQAGARIRAVVAYEPEWAIGAERSALPEHIRRVCSTIKQWLDVHPSLGGSRVIYGGSAGPGLVSGLGHDVDGVFLGRFAHRPEALVGILDEALALAG